MNIFEKNRLKALHNYNILDTEVEEAFENLAKLAANICGTEVSQINFIDKNRQWSKATVGWGPKELPRDISFCVHTIESETMIVEDSLLDERFKDNPLVKGDPALRFYAGVTLKSEDNYPLGAICVYDSKPGNLTEKQMESLQILAKEVQTHLRLRINQNQLKERVLIENKFNNKIIDTLPVLFFMYNKKGKIMRWNENLKKYTRYLDKEFKDMHPADFFDESDKLLILNKMKEVFQGNEVMFEASLVTKDDIKIPHIISASSLEIEGKTYMIGTAQDISRQKNLQSKLEGSLKEKEVLLSELHHRVKNNLAIISGLIQLETSSDEEIREHKSTVNTLLRIKTMAQVHELMYDRESLTHVPLRELVTGISENIIQSELHSDNIKFNYKINDITLNINQAIPCGMVINELLKNACKNYKAEEDTCEISLNIEEINDHIKLKITDRYRNYSAEAIENNKPIKGLNLVEIYCAQLDAEFDILHDNGTEYLIEFEKKEGIGSSSALNLHMN